MLFAALRKQEGARSALHEPYSHHWNARLLEVHLQLHKQFKELNMKYIGQFGRRYVMGLMKFRHRNNDEPGSLQCCHRCTVIQCAMALFSTKV